MSWWGKAIGGTFGFMLGGPLGALIGASVGHHFDAGLTGVEARYGSPGDQERTQAAFFTATFSVMGHLAKADGKVTRDELDLARSVMERMQLNAELRQAAERLFSEGKATGFPLDEVLEQFRRECHRRKNLVRMFVEIQLHAAYADGVVHPAERHILEHICGVLRISSFEFRGLEALVRAGQRMGGQGADPSASGKLPLEDAYDILNVSAQASDAEVKRAYRRLMSRHHPDKLVAKGLPEEMMKMATEKTQEIRAAYECVRKARAA